jgi:hypothetical protein
MMSRLAGLLVGLALAIGVGGAAAQTVTSTVDVSTSSVSVSGGFICTLTGGKIVCKPITKTPEIDAASGSLALAFVGVAMLLSAEMLRRRS